MSQDLRFHSLRLQNWKNFSSVDVAIQDRVFLVGPNASGKSNVLDVFRFLRDLASSGGGFYEAISRRGGVSAIRSLAARRYPDVEIHVGMRSGGHASLGVRGCLQSRQPASAIAAQGARPPRWQGASRSTKR